MTILTPQLPHQGMQIKAHLHLDNTLSLKAKNFIQIWAALQSLSSQELQLTICKSFPGTSPVYF